MKNEELVSIIVPCYNSEKYLMETLYSLENQTYQNIEIICVDDGSTDNTKKILESWHKQTKIKNTIINQKNQGVSHARNIGIKNAKGKYVMFCDADDTYKNELINLLINEIHINKKDTAYCNVTRKQKNKIKNIEIINQSREEAMNSLLYNMSKISFTCYIYIKEILDEHNIRFDEDTKYFEDREFNWKYLCWCNDISHIDEELYYYRINNNSATRKVPTWDKLDSLKAVKRVETYLKENKCNFYENLKSYLYSRVVWGIAKTFAVGKQKELYKRFIHEYKIRKHMIRMLKDKQKSVVIGSILYLINPYLFYFVLSKVNK